METLLPSKSVHSFNLNSFQEKGRTKRQRRGYVRSYVVEELDGWLDGGLDVIATLPFYQYFRHIKTMGG